MHTPNPADLRVIKTKKSIHQAFFMLLKTHDFHDITIQHILDAAQINRTTFYKHYANKNDLAQKLIKAFLDDVLAPLFRRRFQEPLPDFLQQITHDIQTHREFLGHFWQINTPKIHLQKEIHTLIAKSYATIYKPQDGADRINLQGHLYASFALSVMDLLITHDNIDAATLMTNINKLTLRTLPNDLSDH